MRTFSPEFQEAFVKQCYDRGMSEEVTLELFRRTHLLDVLENDTDFREGFEQEINKRADWKTKALLGLGTLGAAGAATKTLAPDFASTVPFLQQPQRGVAEPVGAGLGAAAGLKTGLKFLGGVHNPWVKGLALAGSTALGAGAGYGAGHMAGAPNIPNGPGAAGPFLPDALQPGDDFESGARASRDSLLTIPGAGIMPAGRGGHRSGNPAGGHFAPGETQGSRMIQQSNEQVQNLNTDIADAREQATKALSIPGIQGSSQAMEIRRRIADLEKQKHDILNSSNSYMGQMRQQQGQSLRSIDQAMAQALDARQARQPQADAMDRWLRNGNQGSWWYKLLNHLTGAENQASQLSNQLGNLDNTVAGLNNDRGRVRNMLQPES